MRFPLFFLLALLTAAARAQAPGDAPLYNLLIQKVCVDAHDHPVPADPISCPDHRRNLRPGEPMPYHRYDQPHQQQHDSYPQLNLDGSLVVNNPFNYAPFDEFNANGDGYDLYEVHDGWTSVGQTRDGGGFSTTFFGEGCKPYNGWVFFPATAVQPDTTVTLGETYAPINSNYWEHNGESWPGRCPPVLSKHSLTTWETVRDFEFGGIDGNPIRKLTTVRSVHGFSDSDAFRARGHLEVFYFTVLYGTTRWEVWTPKSQVDADPQLQHEAANEQKACRNPSTMQYRGQEFYVTSCRDWSSIEVLEQPTMPPVWPLPAQNMLQNFHFTADWNGWQKSATTSLTLEDSKAPSDAHYIQTSMKGKGVRFVRIDCAGQCHGDPILWQDVSAPSPLYGDYTVAATLRTENGEADVRLELLELDAKGRVLSRTSQTQHIGPKNGRFTGDMSVTLSASFLTKTLHATPNAQVKKLRWSLQPLTNATFDLVDAWLIHEGTAH